MLRRETVKLELLNEIELMSMDLNNIKRNNLDYLLTDILPTELSDRFTYSYFYKFLLSKSDEIDDIIQCLKKTLLKRYDVIFMDHLMPEMDGIQALKKIKAADASATVIMCSAMGQQAMVIEAIQSGARDFIVKPFQADRVLESIKKVLG